jgi:6,7-dimethyl-8-ribityllumazine synthase
MNRADKDWRNTATNALTKVVTDALTKAGIDARTLTIGAVDGALLIGGTVPDESTRTKLQAILATGKFGPAIRFEVGVAQL